MFAMLPNAAAVAAAMANGTFNAFAQALEGVHNSGHVWVGGSMGIASDRACRPDVLDAPRGDRSASGLHGRAANPGQNPPLAGPAATMDPWTETEVDTRDITALGFTYV